MTLRNLPLSGGSSAARPSLPEVHRSVGIPQGAGWLRRFLSFAGPGYLVSVGYMDPGNWATDLEGGSRFGYALLWVILASNLMAILLQTLCARLGLASGLDLAQACRERFKKPAVIALWLLCEVAIIACDLAEVIGSAVALNLLFGIPLVWGVLITSADVLALLALSQFGFRKLEALILVLVSTIAACFALEVFLSKPDWHGVALGLTHPLLPNRDALYVALGILGATVMPHNLYLHSALVQTRAHADTPQGVRQAIRNNTADTVIALMAAFFVNAAILVLAAAVFHKHGQIVTEFQQAPDLLRPLLGGAAATAFGVALLASGQSSTITGTLAGQIVMEGFLHLRIAPWLRRIITRGLAIVPALIMLKVAGDRSAMSLVVWSQVILSLQLSFATFPLLLFTSDRRLMGQFANPGWLKAAGYGVCVAIAALNLYYLVQQIGALWLGLLIATALGFAAWVHWGYRPPPAS